MILTRLKKKIQISSEVKTTILQVLLFGAGFFFMSIKFLFGIYPFGLALVGASKRHTPFIFCGALLSAVFLMNFSVVYIVALVSLLGLRIAFSFVKKNEGLRTEMGKSKGESILKLLFSESVELRVSVASLVAMGIGIYNVISNGYAYYDIFVLIFYTVFVGIMTFCFSGAFDTHTKKRAITYAFCSFFFCIVYFFSGRELFGIDFALVISYSIVLYASKYLSGTRATLVGIILGIAQGSYIASIFGISGVVSGFLWGISPYLAVMCSFILSIGYSIALAGYEAIALLVPELLASSLIMYPILRFDLIPKPSILTGEEGKGMELYHKSRESGKIKDKLNTLSSSFDDIATMLRGVSKITKNPDKSGYMDMALEVCEGYCYACPKWEICWNRDTSTTEENINKMGEAVFVNKEVTKKDVNEKFLHRCPNIEKIMTELNEKTKEILSLSVKNDKLEISARDYELVGKILESISEKSQIEAVDAQLTEKAVRACALVGLCCEKIQVLGGKRKRIVATGVDIQRSRCTTGEIRKELQKALGIKLREPVIKEEEALATMEIEMASGLIPKVFTDSVSEENNEINGDTVSSFKGSDGKEYVLICDGMGSGRDANLTSSICAMFLEKILMVTDEKEIALSMLNNFVRAKNMECSSTIDLLEIDTITGESKFIKCGASPSFVKRGDSVFKLQSKTAPIGIMKALDAEILTFNLQKGDLCVMVSDGILSSLQDGDWLMKLLKEEIKDISTLPERIIKKAKKNKIGKDDMSVASVVLN